MSLHSTFAQTDNEFWFVAPEITESHGIFPGGEPVYFRISALDLSSIVRINQPARPAGLDTTFNVAANSTVSIEATAWIDDIENIPGGLVLDKGIHITSTNLVTVYYDENEFYNRDIFALKGKNALGYEFYTPFNDVWRNGDYIPVQPYSAIDIVATQDNTQITVTPVADIVGHPAGIPFVVTLNRGETYSCLATSQMAAGHLGGTHIVSNKPIAVSIKDDSVWAQPQGCRDLIGDQTVPMRRTDGRNIAGYEYIAMRGKINLNNSNVDPIDGVASGERVFIMATQPNTQVFIDGALYATIVSPGEQVDYQLIHNSTHIMGDKRIMVLHVSGFGCELGGAVLPTIDGCTGSLEVSFTRSTNEGFYLNIMTTGAARDAFTMHYEDGSTFDIPGGWFEDVGTTGFVCLSDAHKLFALGTGGGVPQDQVVKITNSVSVFHLGLIEGGRSTGCKYGYFSDYAETRGSAMAVESGSQSIGRCFGDSVQFRATGGLTYTWSPVDYLDDPFIANPVASPPPGVYNYTVTITRPCFADTSFTIIVGISTEVEAFFDVDKWYLCAPDLVTFDNRSFGVDKSDSLNVQWDFDLDDPANPYVYDTSRIVQYTYQNTTDSVERKTIQLLVWNPHGCVSEFQRELMVRPEITAGFTADVTQGCHPLDVGFTNASTGNIDRYKWTLGDGNSSNQSDPSHTYLNQGMADSVYHVSMVAISPFYCSDTAGMDISVYPYLEADFAIDTFRSCSPFILEIDNNSAGYIEEYEWDFGDGTSSDTAASFFTHLYTNTSNSILQATIHLAVRNISGGCADTIIRAISVFPEVTAGFTQDTTAGCNGLEVRFTNQSSSTASMFSWDFGDGGSSSQLNPAHIFENMSLSSADYTVRLVSTSDDLCRDTAYQDISVHPYINALFSTDEFQGCAPFRLTVLNASDGAISQYEWDWGDGSAKSSSGGSSLSHIYQNNDSLPVVNPLQLVVSNADGCSDTLTRDITVFPLVISQFTQDVSEGCNPLAVQFNNQSNAFASSFLWEFGDGGSSDERDPLHLYQNFDTFNITSTTRLIAFSEANCTDTSEVDINVYSYLNAGFTLDHTTSCTPFSVSFDNSSVGGVRFKWDFGDGSDTTVLAAVQVNHRYDNSSLTDSVQYTAMLTAWNADSCISQSGKTITVFPEVNAGFSADTSRGCPPLTVSFTNGSTGASALRWDFSNGRSSDDPDPVVTFDNYGSADKTCNVMLVAFNSRFCTDTMVIPVTVHPYVEADFSIDDPTQCTPASVTFYNSSVNGGQFTWTFDTTVFQTGSEDPLVRQFRNDSFTASRMFTIELQATSLQGCTAVMTREIQVYHNVEAGFESDSAGCHPLVQDFINASQGGWKYNWLFGDNGTSIMEEPVHTYSNLGDADSVFTVELVVTSDEYCTDTVKKQVTVYARPVARFQVDNTIDCPPMELNITNLTEAGDTYHWDFGDGSVTFSTSDLSPVSHTYYNDEDNTRTRILQLVAGSVNGCLDTISQNINVYPAIMVDFERDSAGCSPYLSAFNNTSVRITQHFWDFGDGNSSLLVHPTHNYVNNSMNDTVFTVSLTGASRFGCTDSVTRQVTVYPSPLAEFDFNPVYQYYPDATVSLSNETNEGNWDYLWDHGDGKQSDLENPGSYTYEEWGQFNITLDVFSDHCDNAITHWIRIYPPQPLAEFEPDIDSGCVEHVVTFSNSSQYAEEYYWDFDDGNTSTEFEPVHVYEEPGLYQARLRVTGEGGEDIAYREIEVYPLPLVDFKVAPDTVMLPDQPAKMFNFSEDGEWYLWDFGDGQTSEEAETSHLYTELGVYDVSLTVWTRHNCTASLTIPQAVVVIGEGRVKFPTAFAPNRSGPGGGYYSLPDISNEIFHPFYEGVTEYNLLIFTRWGELIFESNDVNIGWDGYYRGELCQQGVYFWIVKGHYINGLGFEEAGDVTLLLKPRDIP